MISNDSGKTARILVVDDEPSARFTLKMLLSSEAFDISYASNGIEALSMVESLQPDVILLDVMMPYMTGYEVSRKLKAEESTRHIPIILVTALDKKEDLVLGLDSGADEFLSKPVNGPELRARVQSMLRMKRLYDDMQETMKLREDLVHLLMHDMKNPLSTIMLFSDVLLTQEVHETKRHKLSTIRKQAHRLNAFIGDMLVMAKMNSGRLNLDLAHVDLKEITKAAVEDYIPLADSKNIKLQISLPESSRMVRVDRPLIRRTFDNLLSNAVKFSDNDSTVKICMSTIPGNGSSESDVTGTRIQFIDNGPGIPEAYHDRIFEKYEIVTASLQSTPQFGLGLAFCRLAVEAHHGRIYVADNEPSGSVFTVDLY